MRTGGTRVLARAIIVSVVVAVTGAALTVPAVAADDPQQRAAAYYAALAERAAGTAPTEEQVQANLEAGLASTARAFAGNDDPARFVDGNLVSDAVFFKRDAWTATQIQTFLNTKGAGCVGAACLKSYTATTPSKAADAACSAYTGQTGATAAQIFAGVGLACGVNPVVLISLVQKEQGLVTSTAPTPWMYDHATGWLCPDTSAGCNSTPNATGFFNQVYGAAWQFRQYGSDPDFDWFPVGTVSPVRYNVDRSCGSKQVAIQNAATAALYYYTPYTPNAASLASYPGEGNGCSAYGIRNFWMLFNAWYGDSTAGSSPSMSRIAGSDRFETSAAISRAAYPSPGSGIPAAYVANGMVFPDALAAAPAAAHRGGPLLLSTAGSVPAVIVTELQRLKPRKIYVVGGPDSLSDAVQRQLTSVAPVQRVSGGDRFQTSQAIAADTFGGTRPSTAYLAYGLNFPDALSAGAAAGAKGYPVLLMHGTAPDAGTISTLRSLGVSSVKVVGGAEVIPNSYLAGVRAAGFTATRISGDDRFTTSLAIMRDAFPTPTASTLLASGMEFPDALSAAAYAGRTGSALLVTSGACVYPGSAELALRSTAIGLIGGTEAQAAPVGALSICE